jgi:hypothetical protein
VSLDLVRPDYLMFFMLVQARPGRARLVNDRAVYVSERQVLSG